jgi:hypothetical protein
MVGTVPSFTKILEKYFLSTYGGFSFKKVIAEKSLPPNSRGNGSKEPFRLPLSEGFENHFPLLMGNFVSLVQNSPSL